MFLEAKVKQNSDGNKYFDIGQIIRVRLFPETGEVRFEQSKHLIWEKDYAPFNQYPFEDIVYVFERAAESEIVKELNHTSTNVIYGCIVDPPIDGAYYVTFHRIPQIIHELARVTLESRKQMIDEINTKRMYEGPRFTNKNHSDVFRTRCYCGAILDNDINERCPKCTGLKCKCGKCHCTEGKSFY